jgi:hypothetical protein
MIWSNGKYYLKNFAYDAAVMTLTEDDIDSLPDRFNIIIPGIPETPNTCRVHYCDTTDNYIVKMLQCQYTSAVTSDDGVREIDIPLMGITNYEDAAKLGAYYVKRARYNKSYVLTCHPRTIALEPGDMIQMTHSFPGWTNQVLRVESRDISQEGKVVIKFQEENSDIYDLSDVNVTDHEAYETTILGPLPAPDMSGYTPTVTACTWSNALKVDWSDWEGIDDYKNIIKYEVYASLEATCTITAENLKGTVSPTTYTFYIQGLSRKQTYDIRVMPYYDGGQGTASD